MAKSNRHKKLRKQEKAKTQLTGVKKLNKAQNVVEPTLRVKKILIREQLKTASLPGRAGIQSSSSAGGIADGFKIGSMSSQSSVITEDEETYTRRRQNVQDLLSSANHHNVNMRKDALVGLQEIAASNFNAILRNLDRIITRIAGFASDQEGIIRKENLKLADVVFSKISENQLRPFWSLLIAHLKCALTHLMPSIRYGALSFIELLVDHHSTLVSDSSSIILPTILGLISTTQKGSNESSSKSKSSSSATKLKVEITGKNSDVTERLKVLKMLSKCLSISSSSSSNSSENFNGNTGTNFNKDSVAPTQYLGLRYPFGYCWDQDDEMDLQRKYSVKRTFSNLNSSYSSRFYSTITADPYNSPFANTTTDSSSNVSRSEDFWMDFLKCCVPVLIETWVELGPASTASSSQPSGTSYGISEKKSKGKLKQGLPSANFGYDKDGSNNTGRRNGLHILNEANVDNLLCITTLFDQLFERSVIAAVNGNGAATSPSCKGIEGESVKTIRKTQGQNLAKYFFQLMPYVALQDTRRKDVITLNLKLFKIAGELKMFDKEMKKNLKVFIEGAMERRIIDKEHCKQILEIMSFIEVNQIRDLCTRFLTFSAKVNHFEIVAKYLSGLIDPTAHYESNRGQLDLVGNLDWNEVISKLIQSWRPNDGILPLLELLTSVALRRLTNMQGILSQHISKLKELFSSESADTNKTWDAIYRTFVYSDADETFKTELQGMYPSNFILVASSS